MRMRRKRNLEPRMEACADLLLARGKPCKNLKEAAETFRALLDLEKVFGNQNPTELEIGCGNGGFLLEKAKCEPHVNFLAVELCTNVILTAMERTRAAGLSNIRFLNIPAEILECYLEQKSVGVIYLNFSTPLPEKSREKQRLTSPRFLEIYKKLLKEGGRIEQKTDSAEFFEYSLNRFEEAGFTLADVTHDLHNSPYAEENIVTEYERNFSEKGLPIFRAVAVKGIDPTDKPRTSAAGAAKEQK